MSDIKEVFTYDGLGYYHTRLKNYLTDTRSVVFCEDNVERLAIPSPLSETAYIVLSPMAIYIYDNEWKCLTSQEAISEEYIDSLFTIDEVGELTNNIAPISTETIDDIWNSV